MATQVLLRNTLMKDYKKEIINRLLDKYEASKSFIGNNVNKQNFVLHLDKEFPEYVNDSKIDEIQSINTTLNILQEKDFIELKPSKNGIINIIRLNENRIDECYVFIKRKPKKDTNNELMSLLQEYQSGDDVVNRFSREQIRRIETNKKAEHFKGKIDEYSDVLKVLDRITGVEQETYVRDFSIRVLGDSKKFEKIKGTIISILDEYGDFPDREFILEDLNIIKNPGHVFVKGSGIIDINGEIINLSRLSGDIALSSSLLKSITSVKVTGQSVVTIENLTTFNSYDQDDAFVIYLGGYHNSLRRGFIKLLHEQNPNVNYYHYGDIDAGGFNILLHLRNKTGVMFMPMRMDRYTLEANKEFTKKLSENDKKRLNNLLGKGFDGTIKYMLENDCKLEQEALDKK